MSAGFDSGSTVRRSPRRPSCSAGPICSTRAPASTGPATCSCATARSREIGAPGAVEAPDGAEVVEAEGLHALPAFVDPHVHLRTPGREDEEDIDTGTRSAAAGGYCAIFAMPNTDPVVDSASILRSLRERARAEARIPTGFIASITVGMGGERADRDGRARRRGRRRLHRRRPAGAVGRGHAPGAPVPAARRLRARAARGGPLAVGRRRHARGRGLRAARAGRHPRGIGVDRGGPRLRAGRLRGRRASTSSTCPRARPSRCCGGRRPTASRSPRRPPRTTCCSPTRPSARSTPASR